MKIGIVSPCNPYELREFLYDGQDVPNVNKGASAVNTLVKEFLRHGHSVKVFTSYDGTAAIKKFDGPQVEIYMCHRKKPLPFTTFLYRLYMVPRIVKMIEKEVADLEILHAHWTYEYAMAAKMFVKKLPVFCTVRDWCPYIQTMQISFKNRLYWMVCRFVFERVMADKRIRFIANSHYTYNCIVSKYPRKDVKIIPNPIERSYILDKEKQYVGTPIFIAISQAIGDKRKNYDRLLLAFKSFHGKYPESRLRLVGAGFVSDNQYVLKWKEQELLSGVELCGFVNHDKLMELIDTSSCLIHPSLEETFGNILLEGMARCKPCIGGLNSGAVPMVLGNGKYGILCDVQNTDSIMCAMEKSLDKKFTMELVLRATHHLKETYASDIVASSHIALYRTFIE